MRIAICIIYVHDAVDVSVNGYVNVYVDDRCMCRWIWKMIMIIVIVYVYVYRYLYMHELENEDWFSRL